jgi:hypothetical protein
MDGRDFTGMPLEERRVQLPELVHGKVLRISEELPGTAAQVLQAVKAMGLEGVVAKRRDSLYEPGERSRDWQKLKLENPQEFVIGGYRPDGENSVDALLVGYYEGRKLCFAGKVRAGLVPHSRRELAAKLVVAASYPAVPIQRSAERQVSLGRWRHCRSDVRDAVDQAGVGGTDSIRRMDGRGTAAACGLSWAAHRQVGRRGPQGGLSRQYRQALSSTPQFVSAMESHL